MSSRYRIDWARIGDMVCGLLTASLKSRRNLEREAKQMGATFEGFIAAGITQQLSEEIERQLDGHSVEFDGETEAEQLRWMKGTFTVAYVLDTVGLLNPDKKAKLDSLIYPGVARWDEAIETEYGIGRTFVRSVYSLCTELKEPIDGVVFILQGLGCPDMADRLAEMLD